MLDAFAPPEPPQAVIGLAYGLAEKNSFSLKWAAFAFGCIGVSLVEALLSINLIPSSSFSFGFCFCIYLVILSSWFAVPSFVLLGSDGAPLATCFFSSCFGGILLSCLLSICILSWDSMANLLPQFGYGHSSPSSWAAAFYPNPLLDLNYGVFSA